MKNTISTFLIMFLFYSCLLNKYERKVKGSYTLGKGDFIMLNDSSIIEGFVYVKDLNAPVKLGSVYIENTKIFIIIIQ